MTGGAPPPPASWLVLFVIVRVRTMRPEVGRRGRCWVVRLVACAAARIAGWVTKRRGPWPTAPYVGARDWNRGARVVAPPRGGGGVFVLPAPPPNRPRLSPFHGGLVPPLWLCVRRPPRGGPPRAAPPLLPPTRGGCAVNPLAGSQRLSWRVGGGGGVAPAPAQRQRAAPRGGAAPPPPRRRAAPPANPPAGGRISRRRGCLVAVGARRGSGGEPPPRHGQRPVLFLLSLPYWLFLAVPGGSCLCVWWRERLGCARTGG